MVYQTKIVYFPLYHNNSCQRDPFILVRRCRNASLLLRELSYFKWQERRCFQISAAGSHRQAAILSLISRHPPEVLPEVSRDFRKLGLKYIIHQCGVHRNSKHLQTRINFKNNLSKKGTSEHKFSCLFAFEEDIKDLVYRDIRNMLNKYFYNYIWYFTFSKIIVE